jgi:uncharacterized protein (DUF433 family)
MNAETLLQRIETNPALLGGRPVIRGTRLPVDTVLKRLAGGETAEGLLAEYPRLEPADIRACLLFAGRALEDYALLPLAAAEA